MRRGLRWQQRWKSAPATIIILIIIVATIIITRPKPAYGRQGLAGSWGQDTDEVSTFWGVVNVSLRACGAQLGFKPTNQHNWNLEKPLKPTLNHEKRTWNLEKPSKPTWNCTGWLWVVQVVTGDSQEEVMIFRYKQTLHYYPTRARSAWARRACALIYIHHDYCCHHHNHCCHDHNHHNHCCHLHNHCCHDHNHHDYCCHHHNHRKQHHHRCERNPNRANIEEVANLVSEALKKFQTK